MNEEKETREQHHNRLLELRHARQKERAGKLKDREIERMELAERFEAQIGAEGSEFAIYDSGHISDPLVVVKRPQLVQWTKYEQSKQTPTDRYDFVAPSVVHPPIDEWNALREKRVGIEIAASNLMAKLMGLGQEAEAGK